MILKDIFTLVRSAHTRIHDHGFVRLVDCMPRLIPEHATGGDFTIARAARVSYGPGPREHEQQQQKQDRTLIRYLMRHKHTSPFEMAEVVFHVKAPIFVARQWLRHRTASVNEWSGRYSKLGREFYRPAEIRTQSASNMQGSGVPVECHSAASACFCNAEREAAENYQKLIEDYKVSREQARCVLPVSVYTQFYWKCDVHNLLHFLRLRMAPDAQAEIRVYATAMHEMLEQLFPVTCEAFDDYVLGAITLSRLDVEAAKTRGASTSSIKNVRERTEAIEKLRALNLMP